MKMNVFLFSAILLCASCSEDEDIIKNEEPMKPNTEKLPEIMERLITHLRNVYLPPIQQLMMLYPIRHSVISAICYFQLTAMCQGL